MSKKTIFLICALLACCVHGQSWTNETCWFNAVYVPYGYERVEPSKRDLDYCTWYNDKTCCQQRTQEEDNSESSFFWGYPFCPKIDACEEIMELFYCGQCSPKYLDYFDKETNKLRICKSFAKKIWKKCQYSGVQYGDTSLDFMTNGYGSGCFAPVGIAKNAKKMVEIGFNAIYTDHDCFNVGNHQLPHFGLLILVGLIASALL